MGVAGEICPLAMPAGLMGGRTLTRSSGSGPCPSFVGLEPPVVSRLLCPTPCDTHQKPVFILHVHGGYHFPVAGIVIWCMEHPIVRDNKVNKHDVAWRGVYLDPRLQRVSGQQTLEPHAWVPVLLSWLFNLKFCDIAKVPWSLHALLYFCVCNTGMIIVHTSEVCCDN